MRVIQGIFKLNTCIIAITNHIFEIVNIEENVNSTNLDPIKMQFHYVFQKKNFTLFLFFVFVAKFNKTNLPNNHSLHLNITKFRLIKFLVVYSPLIYTHLIAT